VLWGCLAVRLAARGGKQLEKFKEVEKLKNYWRIVCFSGISERTLDIFCCLFSSFLGTKLGGALLFQTADSLCFGS